MITVAIEAAFIVWAITLIIGALAGYYAGYDDGKRAGVEQAIRSERSRRGHYLD